MEEGERESERSEARKRKIKERKNGWMTSEKEGKEGGMTMMPTEKAVVWN